MGLLLQKSHFFHKLLRFFGCRLTTVLNEADEDILEEEEEVDKPLQMAIDDQQDEIKDINKNSDNPEQPTTDGDQTQNTDDGGQDKRPTTSKKDESPTSRATTATTTPGSGKAKKSAKLNKFGIKAMKAVKNLNAENRVESSASLASRTSESSSRPNTAATIPKQQQAGEDDKDLVKGQKVIF
jgi:hypothetical protein